MADTCIRPNLAEHLATLTSPLASYSLASTMRLPQPRSLQSIVVPFINSKSLHILFYHQVYNVSLIAQRYNKRTRTTKYLWKSLLQDLVAKRFLSSRNRDNRNLVGLTDSIHSKVNLQARLPQNPVEDLCACSSQFTDDTVPLHEPNIKV